MTRWFGDVPREIRVAGVTLVPAGEALDMAFDVQYLPPSDGGPENERDSPDWGATGVYMIARCQLDEMRSLLTDEDVARLMPGDESVALTEAEAADAQLLREGLVLHRCLTSGRGGDVHHGFNVAGDITITTGVEFPALPALGSRGSPDGEIQDSPVVVLRAAVKATVAAGRWAARRLA